MAEVAPINVQVAAPTTKEDLIEKGFKLVVLVAILAGLAISIVILSFIIEIADIVGAVFSVGGLALKVFEKVPLIGTFASVLTFVISAFTFKR